MLKDHPTRALLGYSLVSVLQFLNKAFFFNASLFLFFFFFFFLLFFPSSFFLLLFYLFSNVSCRISRAVGSPEL